MSIGGLCLVCKDLAQVAQPLTIRYAIDSLSKPGSASRAFLGYAGCLVALGLVKGLFQFWMRVILIGISRDIEYDLRNDLFRHLVGLSPDFYARSRTGDIMARATNDLNAVRMMLGPGVMYCGETSLTFVLAILVMLRVDWHLALYAILPAPAISLAVIFFGRAIHTRFERIQAMFSDISSRVQENLSGVRMIRAFVQEQSELRRFADLNRQYISQNLGLVRIQGVLDPLLEVLIGATFLVVLWLGGRDVMRHRITIGSFVMFNTYMGMLVWPMIALGWVVNLMQRGAASLSRINQIFHEVPGVAGAGIPPAIQGAIEFRHVAVDYDAPVPHTEDETVRAVAETAEPAYHARSAGRALDDLSLHIAAGETVAVVGHTGSGKSTLVSLIPRLMDPSRGSVLVDGIDIRTLDPGALRRSIGFVPQETFLFSATIGQNIAFGVETATHEDIRRAADIAGLSSDIDSFPNGYDTIVGERGITLSGGQKQRTAIARAVLRNPRLLILDDALSSVDTLTEERILTHLTGVMHGRTVILISHRVSTVRQAHKIVVLEKGRIVEQGTHAQLIAAGGYYADLSRKQMLEEELETI